MRLNKSTRHAIRILVDCARSDDRLVKVADLSANLGISPQNVFKVVHLLSRAGLVAPLRGRYGGVRLGRPASDIRIGEVVRVLEVTNISGSEAEGAAASSQDGTIGVNRMLDEAVEAFVTVLNQHTLADMAAGHMVDAVAGPRPPPRKRAAKLRTAATTHAAPLRTNVTPGSD